jgi:prepilin-type N-terminal cleavage/methylation domain-containing protein
MRRPPTREANGGFTIMELMIGIVVGSIFMFAIYGFYDSSLSSFSTHRSEVLAQSQSRDAINQISAQLREAVSPDSGITPPVISLTPTQIEFYADMSRDPAELVPKPQEFLYQITGGALIREVAQPVGASPPYTYSAFSSPETIVPSVANSSSSPLFSAINGNGLALPATMSSPTTTGIELVHINLLTNYTIGNSAQVFSLNADVVPQNPTSGNR